MPTAPSQRPLNPSPLNALNRSPIPRLQARGETDAWAADRAELEVEVVSAVNQARQREEQVAQLTASLEEARRE